MKITEVSVSPSGFRYWLLILVVCHVVTSCISLIFVAEYYRRLLPLAENSASHVLDAAVTAAPFALLSIFFAIRPFNFGYAIGFYLFTLILDYLWLLELSTFQYDHRTAAISAFASGIAFLAPTLLLNLPARPPKFELTGGQFLMLLFAILVVSGVVLAIGASYNRQFVSPLDIYQYREQIALPRPLSYAIGIVCGALLPFAYASFVQLKRYGYAALCLLLLGLFYPVTLTKLALLAPAWLLFLTLLSIYFESRTAIILSLLLPVLVGLLLALLHKLALVPEYPFLVYFGTVNFRMIAMPASALDFYNDFFSTHELTRFCQIGLVKQLLSCPYEEQISVYMQESYHLGYFNASLFATEGIASVGLLLAPLSALACGLIISLASRASAGLPERFVLLSSGLQLHIFLNVPFTVALATNGAAVLFFLWYVTPSVVLRNARSTTLQGHIDAIFR
ncbi:hypothetical protein [Bradyrhizobium betae]|uniref:Oligosaccharide repeat unit polymerase n=1 Tax=Bradyrhizobium betae TaxID=244734 RepID=A0A5P6PB79_9BRAD|nr:hypothetical protein [Bradyrhizobium betae]MCS3726369.1 hypothetical protein [Bradyrhizobium betae]QFI75619.1 hypothetical protein F8237_26400 [Bradyrhizobium betae]